jgi:hypothetical protein
MHLAGRVLFFFALSVARALAQAPQDASQSEAIYTNAVLHVTTPVCRARPIARRWPVCLRTSSARH